SAWRDGKLDGLRGTRAGELDGDRGGPSVGARAAGLDDETAVLCDEGGVSVVARARREDDLDRYGRGSAGGVEGGRREDDCRQDAVVERFERGACLPRSTLPLYASILGLQAETSVMGRCALRTSSAGPAENLREKHIFSIGQPA